MTGTPSPERRKLCDYLPGIKAALIERNGPMCFECIAVETDLPVAEVTRCLQHSLLTGFMFARLTCTACGNLAWTTQYRTPPPGSIAF